MRYVRYQSIGNTGGIVEHVDDYWELRDDGSCSRSINVLPDGTRLKYDERHDADTFGVLPEGLVTAEMLEDRSLGVFSFVSVEQFEAEWRKRAKNR